MLKTLYMTVLLLGTLTLNAAVVEQVENLRRVLFHLLFHVYAKTF